MTDTFRAVPFKRNEPSLHEALVAFLREHDEGTSASVLAERFLKFKNPDPKLANAAIAAVLSSDRRCYPDEKGLWHAAKAADDGHTLHRLPWTAVFCLTDPQTHRLLYSALWELAPLPSCRADGWLIDPTLLSYEERVMLTDGNDVHCTDAERQSFFSAVARAAEQRIFIFLSSHARSLFALACMKNGESPPDDTMLAAELVKAAGRTAARPMTLAALETAVHGAEERGVSARKQGKRFAGLLAELLQLLRQKGIESRADLDRCGREEKDLLFSGKKFSYNDILALPTLPGVYGFKDREDSYLYIGKAKNLKRRLASYFADTDESPGKLRQLREKSHAIITHRCGSELECLLLEYRLIKKFVPPLNTKIEINERRGTFRPLHDAIVLLPHTEQGKGMSVWLRENQKILLKAFDATFPEGCPLPAELEAFFFTPKLVCDQSDFPEQEIAVRWIKRHDDLLAMVPVNRMASAEEVYNAMRIAWLEFSDNGLAGPEMVE